MYRYVDYIKSDLEGMLQLEPLSPMSYITVDFTPLSIRQGTDAWQAYFSTNPENYFMIRHNGAGTSWRNMQFHYGGQSYVYSGIQPGDDIVAELNPTGITINGVVVSEFHSTYSSSADFYLGGWVDPSQLVPTRQTEGKYRSIVVKDGNSQVLNRYVPALNDNFILGMYDEVNDQFYEAPSGWTYGSVLHTFSPDKTKITFESTGGTDVINVEAETSWSASTEDDWITITKDGDSLTVEVPLYELSERRRGTIYFEDNDGYTFTVSITQKAQSGAGFSTIYKGEENITDMYLGEVKIDSIYLGELQVLASGPFEGLKVTPKELKFLATVSQLSLKIKSSEPWSISTESDWLSFSQSSGETGETTITVTSTAEEDSEGTIIVTAGSYQKEVEAYYNTAHYVTDIYYPNSSTKVPITTPILSTTNLVTEFKGTDMIKTGDDIVASTFSDDLNDYRFFYYTTSVYFDLKDQRMMDATLGISVNDFDIMFGTKINSASGSRRLFIKNVKTETLNEGVTVDSVIAPSEYMYANVNFMHLKELKMWDSYDGTLIFDGKAAELNGKGGLYDSISNQFYTNPDYDISYTE